MHDCVQQLPKLHVVAGHQLLPRCSMHYTACSAMLKHVLQALDHLSPRVCRLLAQIWDLTALNVFVLIQLANSELQENDALHAKWTHAEQMLIDSTQQNSTRNDRYEDEIEKSRLAAQQLRAELQKTEQRLRRVLVENSQLRRALNGLTDPSGDARDGDSSLNEEFTSTDADDDQYCFGVASDDVDKVETIHPIESHTMDFDRLFQDVLDQERHQVTVLNEMDRFINSSAISLLWRNGSNDAKQQRLHQMMNRKNTSSQTDEIDDQDQEQPEQSSLDLADEAVNTLVTKRPVIPATLRAQLESHPKITRVLDKDTLSQLVLQIYLHKMEADGLALRGQSTRPHLHSFLKTFFVQQYGLVPLAEFHMMELVKSCLYYHEKHQQELRKSKLLVAVATQNENTSDLVIGLTSLVDVNGQIQVRHARETRVALFSALCELVPLNVQEGFIGGNLFSCALNTVVDALGDIVELEDAVPSLDSLTRSSMPSWTCSWATAMTILSHHLAYVQHQAQATAEARLLELSPSPMSASLTTTVKPVPSSISVDVVLAVLVASWLEYDQRMAKKLHERFRRQMIDAANGAEIGRNRAPLETLSRMWATIPEESLSPLDLDTLKKAFQPLLESKQLPPVAHKDQRAHGASRRRSTKVAGRTHSSAILPAVATAANTIGGITEHEFVFHSIQSLRTRRNTSGIRTNGDRSILLRAGHKTDAPAELKPGFRGSD